MGCNKSGIIMNIGLNQILEGATAIPYNDTLITTLDTELVIHTRLIMNLNVWMS